MEVEGSSVVGAKDLNAQDLISNPNTRTTERIYPRLFQGQIHHALSIANWFASYQLGFLTG